MRAGPDQQQALSGPQAGAEDPGVKLAEAKQFLASRNISHLGGLLLEGHGELVTLDQALVDCEGPVRSLIDGEIEDIRDEHGSDVNLTPKLERKLQRMSERAQAKYTPEERAEAEKKSA